LSDEDPVFLPSVLRAAGLVKSSSEARRFIAQGAVKVDGNPVDSQTMDRSALVDKTVQVGKRRFVLLRDASGI
jgi:tyrosyl-tRNA synthetase